MDEATTYKIYRLLEARPEISQRELAREMGVSLGKINYCLRALIHKGAVKTKRFCTNTNKCGYLYVLTPQGMEDKARVTMRYLKLKMREYDEIKAEIEEINREARALDVDCDS